MSPESRPDSADVVVVGCGAAGLAAAAQLARRGRRVVGLEQFEFDHTHGSSHGTERIVRVAYADLVHAEMAMRSIDGWRRIERDAGVSLLTSTGGLDIGLVDEIEQIATSCEQVGVPVERLSIGDAARRFPMFRFAGGDEIRVVHHPASTVNADRALVTLRLLAERHGSTFRSGVRVLEIEVLGDEEVLVHHDGGSVRATTCVLAVGAWAGDALVRSAIGNDPRLPALTVTKEQVAFHRPTTTASWPTFVDRLEPCVYGLPTPDGLVKVGEHHTGPVIDMSDRSNGIHEVTWNRLQAWVAERLPGVDPVAARSTTCLYAYYPGDTFLFDRVGPVVMGLGLSGHGFKFVPEVGRRIADLADRVDDPDNPFGLGRPTIDVGASGRR